MCHSYGTLRIARYYMLHTHAFSAPDELDSIDKVGEYHSNSIISEIPEVDTGSIVKIFYAKM